MSNREIFLKDIEDLIETHKTEIAKETIEYFETLKKTIAEDKKEEFTENGKKILIFLQEHQDVEIWKAKDIAEGIDISSRSVSGSMRKLTTDGYVDKIGKDPVIYALTTKGKEIKINNDNE